MVAMNRENRKVAYDCRYFLGDRPCTWHKQEGSLCECGHYQPLKGNVVIIKLDAMGDVLRTTSLLPVIAKVWPQRRISWITRPESVPLLENNPYLARVVPYGAEAVIHLASRKFEKVINLDAAEASAALATMAVAGEKIGYLLHEDGYVIGTNAAAEGWLRMGLFDDLKKANGRSYQEIMCSILDLPPKGIEYVLQLRKEEIEEGRAHLSRIGVNIDKPVVGIHTGGGGRWPLKQWHEAGFVALISELAARFGTQVQVLLLGGPLERELNGRIMGRVPAPVFDAGCDNPVRHFAALVRECSVMLTGDSLAMHIALAMRRRVVVLFGPTSSAEIDLFGLGEKVIPALDCLVCYKKTCDVQPNCMQSVSVEMVKQAILRQLAKALQEEKV